MIKKILKSTLLAILLVVFISVPVLAAYQALIQVVTTTTAYDMFPVILPMDNDPMVTNSYIDADGLDVQVEKSGAGTPRMLTDDKTLFASQFAAASTSNFYYTTDNTPEAFDILIGYDGNITITDDDTLEPGSDFEIEQSGYVDTDAGADKNLVYKEDGFRTYVNGATNITSKVMDDTNVTQDTDTVNDETFWGVDWEGQVFTTPASPFAYTVTSITLLIVGGAEGDTITVSLRPTAGGMPTGDGTDIVSKSEIEVNGATAQNFDIVDTELTAGTLYGICIRADGVNGAKIRRSSINPYADGEAVTSANSGTNWAPVAGFDCRFIVYGYIKVEATATGIASGEYTVKTCGVDNEPAWATGDVLHFTGAADSNVNAGAINDNIAKLWVSLWFRLDSTFSAASATDQYIWSKYIGAADYVGVYLTQISGQLVFTFDDGVNLFTLTSTTNSWTGGTWYHIITSLSNTGPAQRLLVNGTVEDTDTIVASNTPNGGDFCIGARDDGVSIEGCIGEIQNVILGIDDLSTDEEDALYAGTAPGDETDYWYADEGVGTAIISYGSAANAGTADTACSWETATFTTGKTGRWCDFYIEVDDGVTDPDRWGTNLKGASVDDNTNDWYLNQNNVMPYMEYYKHTVGGIEHAWYQPNDIVEATSYDGSDTGGAGPATVITDNTMTDAAGYWVDALVTVTDSATAAMGESRVCTVFGAGGVITVAPAFSAVLAIGDDFTIDFGTLIDRSYYGIEFDGVDDYVNEVGVLLLADHAGTIEFWLNSPMIAGTQCLTRSLANNYRMHMINGAADAFVGDYTTLGADNLNGVGVFVADTWHHVVLTYTTANSWLYVDGVEVDTTVLTGTTQEFSNINVGRWVVAVDMFEGIMDEIRIYTRYHPLAEVQYNYNGGAGRYTPYDTTSLVAWWHIETGTGAALADSSGSGNPGVLNNGIIWENGQVPRPAGNAGTNDSRITWGVNPSDITLLLGSLYSDVVTLPATAEPAQDIMPETPVMTLFGMTAPTNMFSPLFDTFADIINLPSVILWVTVSMLFVVGGVVAFYFLTKNGTYSAFVGVFLLAICVVMGTVPWWTIIIGMLLAVYAAIAKSRQVS